MSPPLLPFKFFIVNTNICTLTRKDTRETFHKALSVLARDQKLWVNFGTTITSEYQQQTKKKMASGPVVQPSDPVVQPSGSSGPVVQAGASSNSGGGGYTAGQHLEVHESAPHIIKKT